MNQEHNFFAQDRQFQGRQQSQGAEDREEDGYLSQFKHGPNFIQSTLMPQSVKGPNELQPNMNNFGYGNLFHQSGQNEESLLAMGMSSRGLPFHGLQQGVPNHFTNSSVSSETPLSGASFDLFNGQQQTIHQQSNMLQFLQPQPSGTSDVQMLHQQLMGRRMQELQRQQQQTQQFNQSTLVNGRTSSDVFQYPLSAEDGSNWIYQNSPDVLGFQPNIMQTQQLDQSLYGAPISSSRFLPTANDSHVMLNRSSIPQSQMSVPNSYRSDSQHNFLTDHVQIASSKKEAALDPEEKMFLFSSDDNIRDAFGAVPSINEEVNIFGDGGFSNSLAGGWSALMQSAVEETSGNAPSKEFGLSFEGNNGQVVREQHLNGNLLQTSQASLHQNQAGVYSDTLAPSGLSTGHGWNTMSSMMPGSDSAETLKHSTQNRQATMMQGSSSWKQNPDLIYDTELGYLKSGNGEGINDPRSLSHNPPRNVNANSSFQNHSLVNQLLSARRSASSLGGNSSQKLQNLVLGSVNSRDGDKTDRREAEKYERKESPIDHHHSSLNQHSPHGYKEGGPFNMNDPRSPSPGRQNSSNKLPSKIPAPRKFRYHPMGNVDENMIAEHSLQQQAHARAMPQQNAPFGRSNLFNQGSSRELPGEANNAENMSSGNSHQAHSVPIPISQNMLELLNKADQEKDRPPMTHTSSSARQGFGLHLGPPSQRLQLSHNSQGGKASSPQQMPRNISSGFIAGIPSSKNHVQSQQLATPMNSSGQHQLVQSQIPPSSYQNILESSSSPLMEGMTDHILKQSTNQSESVSNDRVPGSIGKELSVESHFKNLPANSSSMLEEIKDLGQSLGPSSFSEQPFSFANQTQALRNANIDGSLKIKEGSKSIADAPVSSLEAGFADIVPGSVSQHGNIASQHRSVLDSTISQSHSNSDHQMAPPWSSSYENLKTGQLQIHDAIKADLTTRPGEQMSALGKSTRYLNALNSDEKGTSAPFAAPESSVDGHNSPSLPHMNVIGQPSMHLGPKKHKNDTFGRQPWHKEISDESCPKSHSMASVKSVPGKVDDIAEPTVDASPALRAKKRLMRSSHLMQQLTGPKPETILSVDAKSSYDVAPYAASRIALGDACHEVSFASKLDGFSTNLNHPPLERRKSLARNVAQRHEMAAKELTDRVMAIKGKLARMEASAQPLLDLRTEYQDWEKYATLRRLHRFHVRGQTDSVETTSALTSARKPPPERYVRASPVTTDIPEDVKCLSL